MPLTRSGSKWKENHERLYHAALSEIERVGLSEARIEKICQIGGVTRPTFYAHFTNKEGVVSELLHDFMDGIAQGLEARMETPHDLEGVIDELVDLCHQSLSTTSERLRREIAAFMPRHHDITLFQSSSLFAILAHAIHQASIRREIRSGIDPRALAIQLTVIISAFYTAYPADPDRGGKETREVLKLVLRGLRP